MRRGLLIFVIACLLVALGPVSYAALTSRVSVSSSGQPGNYDSGSPSISSDGRYVAFDSVASNLVSGETSIHYYGIFVHDRLEGTTECVSVSLDGQRGDGPSRRPSISSDGRYVAFHSVASNLVPVDTSWTSHVYVRDRLTGVTEHISVSSGGEHGNDSSCNPSISVDGRYVAFESDASNLVPGDTNGTCDIFIRDRLEGTTERVCVSSSGVQGNGLSQCPSISSDGRYVAFESLASNLVPGDTNEASDVFVRDMLTGNMECVSVSSGEEHGNGGSYNPSISSDGQCVAFYSSSTNLIAGDTSTASGVVVRDRVAGTTERISVSSSGLQANSASFGPSISSDGRYVAFWSLASNLVAGDTNGASDVFIHDRLAGMTERISVSSSGEQGNGHSGEWSGVSINSDGQYVTFVSKADSLVPGDTNGCADIFVRDRWGSAAPIAAIAELGVLESGSEVQVTGKIASTNTFSSPSMIYIQEPLRSAGVMVLTPQTVREGDQIRVTGRTGVWGSERAIIEGTVEVLSTEGDPPKPLGMRNIAVGGEGSGIKGVSGLYNTGLLIKTWGRVTQIGPDYLYIDDGSGLRDDTSTGDELNLGLRVACSNADYQRGEYLLVTGMSSCFQTGDATQRMVRVRKSSDVVRLGD